MMEGREYEGKDINPNFYTYDYIDFQSPISFSYTGAILIYWKLLVLVELPDLLKLYSKYEQLVSIQQEVETSGQVLAIKKVLKDKYLKSVSILSGIIYGILPLLYQLWFREKYKLREYSKWFKDMVEKNFIEGDVMEFLTKLELQDPSKKETIRDLCNVVEVVGVILAELGLLKV